MGQFFRALPCLAMLLLAATVQGSAMTHPDAMVRDAFKPLKSFDADALSLVSSPDAVLPAMTPASLVNPTTAGNDRNDGETYFAIGDSITSNRLVGPADVLAMGPSAFATATVKGAVADSDRNHVPDVAEGQPAVNLPNGESTYLNVMRDIYHPWASADHSMSGSGGSSAWGVNNVGRFLDGASPEQTFVVLLGHNDPRAGISPAQTASNLLAIHSAVSATGAKNVWCNLIIPAADGVWAEDFEERVAAIDAAAASQGAVAVPFYDALDIHPYNGKIDAQDPIYFRDGIHPNQLGQLRMAEMLWSYLDA